MPCPTRPWAILLFLAPAHGVHLCPFVLSFGTFVSKELRFCVLSVSSSSTTIISTNVPASINLHFFEHPESIFPTLTPDGRATRSASSDPTACHSLLFPGYPGLTEPTPALMNLQLGTKISICVNKATSPTRSKNVLETRPGPICGPWKTTYTRSCSTAALFAPCMPTKLFEHLVRLLFQDQLYDFLQFVM